ncbi:inositol monophosphatase family protein [Devosia sp. Root635]|uniref:inositol monophosphatase family protein n=1 Tax=Devosia sp. Root635 TaxID=1736575 RepID=UPI0006F387B3|nr:inositol monophosphatase family protein [Devosia sp. Root635]KRA43306.1 inositol monophosphatase [Devosia sp. Root635]
MTAALAGPAPAVDLDERVEFLRGLAASAGALARVGFVRRTQSQIAYKGPQDFLTETDSAVENHIKSQISAAFPRDGFLGEETGSEVLGDNLWVVDPIDGTANFARAIPHFCISIAFVSRGRTMLGAIYNPALDELYIARRGGGAELNGVPIRVAITADPAVACVELGWSRRVPQDVYVDTLERLLNCGANVRRGASGALALAYVADGRSDCYAELHMQPWDCLAGLLLVEEAGGVVVPFLERDGLSKGGAVLAVAPALAELMSEATRIDLGLRRAFAGLGVQA